ncbi:MAG: acetate--CoA ligase family protein, partial [Acetobacteraceae bacterium]
HSLESLFWPRSVAVLGASPDPQRVRGRLFDNLRGNAFRGRLVPVNPSYSDLHGFPCYPNLAAAGEPADVALLAIPAAQVIAAAEECAAAGVRHVVIISSGFAEEGGSAIGLQQRLAEIARHTGMTITGPNCEGFFNLLGGVAATFSPTAEPREPNTEVVAVAGKPVGVIAQSGGVGFALFARGRAAGLAFSYVVSTGNEAGLTTADFLDYMVQDDRTAAVMLFCEAVRDGARFVDALAAARRRGKPIIAIKIGGSEAGRRATASHTASLSGWQTAYKAVFARYGVIEASDPDDAVAIAGVLTTCPLPKGRRTAVVTVSGGGGAWMADTLAAHGLALPALSPGLQAKLRSLMPTYGASQNPVDVTAQGANTGPAMMDAGDLLVASNEIDMLVLITSLANEKRVSLDPARLRALAEKHNKPIAVWTYTPPSSFGRTRIAESGLFLHVGLRGCGIALGCLVGYAERITRPLPTPVSLPTIDLPRDLPLSLTEYRAKTLLRALLPRQEERLVYTVAEAAAAATAVGFPVAVKLQSPDILHKTEAGCVRLGLPDDDAVARAFVQVWQAAEAAHPGAHIEGVLVQRMAPPGYELVVGMVNDPIFGPIMMVGWGGTAVELMGDVVHCPAPVDSHEATEMIGSLRSARLLRGFRGAPPVDVAPVAELVAGLSRIALAARDCIQEMEFNPVILHADGSGLTIADALITVRAEQPMAATPA